MVTHSCLFYSWVHCVTLGRLYLLLASLFSHRVVYTRTSCPLLSLDLALSCSMKLHAFLWSVECILTM